jgi:hypothetical protein
MRPTLRSFRPRGHGVVLALCLALAGCQGTNDKSGAGEPAPLKPEELASRSAKQEAQSLGAFLADVDGQMRAWNRLFLSSETDEDRRKARLLELNLMSATRKRSAELLQTLESGAPTNRIVAAAALGFTREAPAQGPLIAALSSEDERLRSAALLGLWLLGRSDTPLDKVCELLRNSVSEEERNNAALCLLYLVRAGAEGECVLAAARAGIVDPLPGVRAQCTLLLAQLKDSDSFQPIADRLHDETNFVALAAGRSLAYLGKAVTAEKGRCARALVKAWTAVEEPRKSAFMRDMLALEPPRNYGEKEEDWLEWSLRLP